MKSNQWVSVYSTVFMHQAKIAVQLLNDNDIHAVIMNKRDSSYTTFGEIEVHVKQNDVIRAKQLIKALEA